MRGTRLSVLMMLAVSIGLCLLAASAISGEHPWGQDQNPPIGSPGGGGSNPDQPPDTVVIVVTSGSSGGPIVTGGVMSTACASDLGWGWQMVTRASYWVAKQVTYRSFTKEAQRSSSRIR